MKATLISWTLNPIATLATIWEASKTDTPLADIQWQSQQDSAQALFRAVLDQEIPVAEAIVFNFMCEDVPISWREQAVRHRVGVSYGDNFAVDVIPDADMSFWSQSHRLKDMSNFSEAGEYFTPETIRDNRDARLRYQSVMDTIAYAYADLVRMGIPSEDARNLLPLGTTHRIAMTINLRALKGIVGKRGCWILQAGIWGPIIESIVDELATKVDPAFRSLVYPPCVSAGRFTECKFKVENERRVSGEDNMPICPLYWTSTHPESFLRGGEHTGRNWGKETADRIPQYARLWNQPELEKTWRWSEDDAVTPEGA